MKVSRGEIETVELFSTVPPKNEIRMQVWATKYKLCHFGDPYELKALCLHLELT